MPVYSINFYPIKLRNSEKKTNKCRTQSEECGVYARIVRKNWVQFGNLHQPVNYDSISAKKSETLELVASFCFTVIKIYK